MPEDSQPYDRPLLYKNLSEVQGYLAELRYIDIAVAYMEEEQASWWRQVPLTDLSSDLEVEYGKTHPFKKFYQVPNEFRFPWQDSRREQVQNQLEVIAEEASSWAATEVETIVGWIEPFTWPVGSLYESECIGPVVAAQRTLDLDVSTDFGKLDYSIRNWHGAAAENFVTNFYTPFGEDILDSQQQLLLSLAGGIEVAKAIAESTQHSIMNVVHYTRAALLEQLQLAAAEAELARQESLRNTMIIGGAGATLLAGLIVPGGGLWGVSLATVAGGASIASTAIPDGAWVPLSLQGATAVDLAKAMSDAIVEIEKNDGKQHHELMLEVNDVLGRVEPRSLPPTSGYTDDVRLVPMQPAIVDGVDGSDFYLPDP
jgi:hypothetical protein